ncbi:conserved hypothetical protein [Pseudomonas sp. IT-P176]
MGATIPFCGGVYTCSDEPENNAVDQAPRVIVDVHREQARSHKVMHLASVVLSFATFLD